MDSWFILALGALTSFAGMALVFKKLTYTVSTPVILTWVCLLTGGMYLVTSIFKAQKLTVDTSTFLLLFCASILAFLGNFFDLQAIRFAPNPGYATAVKSGSIVVITVAGYFIFSDQQLSATGIIGIALIFAGVACLSLQ